jgi:hypothetical protein
MVIGYSFGDPHINEVVRRGAAKGLKLFIVDPVGVDAANPTRGAPIQEPNPFQNALVGASRRLFRDMIDNDPIERGKVLHFLKE